MNKDRCIISLIIVVLTVYTIGLICAWNTPCIGYEPSIYDATPGIFWFGILSAYILGIFLIICSLQYPGFRGMYQKIGYVLLTLAITAFASVNLIRGYFIFNVSGDTGSHIGWINSLISETGSLVTSYPFVHIEPAMLVITTGLGTIDVLPFLPILTTLFTTLGIILVAREVLPFAYERHTTYIIALLLPMGSATVVGLSYIYYSSGNFAYSLIPLLFYMLLRLRDTNPVRIIPASIIVLSIAFYHPLVGVIGLLTIGVVILWNICSRIVAKTGDFGYTLRLVAVASISSLIFLIWHFGSWAGTIVDGLLSLFQETDVDDLSIGSTTDLLSTASSYGYSIDTVFQIATVNIILYALTFAALFFLFHKRKNISYRLLWAVVIFGFAILGITALCAFGAFDFGYGRFLRSFYIVLIIGSGFVLSHLISNNEKKKRLKSIVKPTLLMVVLVLIAISSVYLYYPSPNTLNPGYQTTQMEYTGAETLLPLIDYNKNSTGIHMTGLQRYVHAIYGSASTVGSNAYGDTVIISTNRGGTDYAEVMLHHFGYDTGIASLNELYGDGENIFIVEKDRKYYQAYYPELMWDRWELQDFEQLGMDKGLEEVYNNGGLEMYLVC